MPTESSADWVALVQSQTEAALENLLPRTDIAPARLHEAMRYAVLGGGKRVRPVLCYATGEMFGALPDRLEAAACAVELIHGYSLVHDDLPCMDNDMLRRGKPTCHVRFGEATALLAGDALQSLAFQTLASSNPLSPLIRLLAEAAGSLGMAGGQGLDLDAVGKTLSLDALENMHRLKTGALIRAAVLLGAHCGSADNEDIAVLNKFTDSIGLLFQVTHDILDANSCTATLGKTAGKDAANNKPTFVSLLGLDAAMDRAAQLSGQAHALLDRFGERADHLRFITRYIANRKH